MDKCIIYGAGDFGHMACRELSRKYEILFLVDRNPAKEGTKVYDFEVRSRGRCPSQAFISATSRNWRIAAVSCSRRS